MPSFYKKTQKRNPLDPSAPKKWYCVLRRTERAKTRDVARIASIGTGNNANNIESSIKDYFSVILSLLQDGRSVEIEGFGTFRQTVRSKGADTKEELNSTYIVTGNIRFISSIESKEIMNKTKYIDIDDMAKKPD
jgi:Bacterial nucleoid DNA-binding protein